jgi:hypothetical protein
MTDDNAPNRLLKGVSAITSLAVVMLFVLTIFASAQDKTPSMPAPGGTQYPAFSTVQTPLRAPIGHVQPTPRDLPLGLLERETERTKEQIEFDKKLKICRSC